MFLSSARAMIQTWLLVWGFQSPIGKGYWQNTGYTSGSYSGFMKSVATFILKTSSYVILKVFQRSCVYLICVHLFLCVLNYTCLSLSWCWYGLDSLKVIQGSSCFTNWWRQVQRATFPWEGSADYLAILQKQMGIVFWWIRDVFPVFISLFLIKK